MQEKAISIYLNSAGALLLALASALFLINWTSPVDVVQPRDPVLLLSIRDLSWIISGIAAVLALVCFFSKHSTLPIVLLAWLAVNFWIYRIYLFSTGCHSLTGFLGGFSYAFGISTKASAVMADIVFAYLLGGSCSALWIARRLPAPTEYQKIACPSCGTHIKFATQNLGQQISCPHCQKDITLCKLENLKMACVLCGGRVEFPVHAIGQKIPCPHCAKTITLLNLLEVSKVAS
jgi:hypothetical protein